MKAWIKKFIKKYLRPFWFSSKCETIKVPYFYGTVIMGLFIASVIAVIYMALMQYSASVLGAFAGVIVTLAGLYFGTLKLYTDGVNAKVNAEQIKAKISQPSSGSLSGEV